MKCRARGPIQGHGITCTLQSLAHPVGSRLASGRDPARERPPFSSVPLEQGNTIVPLGTGVLQQPDLSRHELACHLTGHAGFSGSEATVYLRSPGSRSSPSAAAGSTQPRATTCDPQAPLLLDHTSAAASDRRSSATAPVRRSWFAWVAAIAEPTRYAHVSCLHLLARISSARSALALAFFRSRFATLRSAT